MASEEEEEEKSREETETETRRPWNDLCPELLHSIYVKLPSHIERAEFGSVCKNWRRTYSDAADYAPPRASHNADFTICTFRRGSTIASHPQQIPDHLRGDFAGASVIGRDESGDGDVGGWWLMSNSAGDIFCCFNPLLQSPNVIELPRLLGCDKKYKRTKSNARTRAAFSAPPTDPDSMILVVHGGGGSRHTTFSTLLRREDWWTNYEIRFGTGRICAGIGYREGKFWCLFDTGEVLIFEIDGHGNGGDLSRRRTVIMVGAARPLASERFSGINYLCTVVKLDGGFEVVNWERVQRGLSQSFWLVMVERETTMAAAEELDVAMAAVEESGTESLVLDQLGMMWKLTKFQVGPWDWVVSL